MVSFDDVKKLRAETGLSIGQCKKSLEDSDGDFDKARELLRKKGTIAAEKKAYRDLGAGVVSAYIHNTKTVGTIVELLCETDFVAKNEEFSKLAYNIAMHATAMNPQFITEAQIPEEDLKKLKNELLSQLEGKPEEMKEKIMKDQLNAKFSDNVLVKQKFIQDDTQTIQGLLENATHKFGERVEIGRIQRFSVN